MGASPRETRDRVEALFLHSPRIDEQGVYVVEYSGIREITMWPHSDEKMGRFPSVQTGEKRCRSMMRAFVALLATALLLAPVRASGQAMSVKTWKHPKMTSAVFRLAENRSKFQTVADARSLGFQVRRESGVRLVLTAYENAEDELIDRLKTMGLTVEVAYDELVQVLCPREKIRTVASLPGIRYIRPPRIRTTDAVSEGLPAMEVGNWHDRGYYGAGVKIAVLDIGFKGYRSLQGSDLPHDLVTKNFTSDGFEETRHGTGCAEIVHDIAPDATLYLAAAVTIAETRQAVDWIIAQGVHIISESSGYTNMTAGDGTGFMNDIVKKAVDRGILWVNSAGNYAEEFWYGRFHDPDGDGWHNFTYDYEGNHVDVDKGDRITVTLTWDDWPETDQDYDLYLDDKYGNTVAQSTDEQSGNQEPFESVGYTATYSGRYYVYVKRYDAAGNRTLRIHFVDRTPGYHTSGHELNTPADAPYVLSVGAMDYSNYTRKSYSSRGPTEDGRTKPDVMAPAGVSAESYWSRGFEGTSAACPHVAGVAALLKEGFPDYDTRLLTTLLISRAHGMGSPRPNDDYGFGLVRMGYPGMNDEPFGRAFVNRGRFTTGRYLRLGVGVLPGCDHPTADVYALVIFPNQLGYVDFKALNWTVSPVAGDIFEYRFTGDEPRGQYKYAVIVTPPGGDMWDSETWIDGRSTTFTFCR